MGVTDANYDSWPMSHGCLTQYDSEIGLLIGAIRILAFSREEIFFILIIVIFVQRENQEASIDLSFVKFRCQEVFFLNIPFKKKNSSVLFRISGHLLKKLFFIL